MELRASYVTHRLQFPQYRLVVCQVLMVQEQKIMSVKVLQPTNYATGLDELAREKCGLSCQVIVCCFFLCTFGEKYHHKWDASSFYNTRLRTNIEHVLHDVFSFYQQATSINNRASMTLKASRSTLKYGVRCLHHTYDANANQAKFQRGV